MARVAEHRNLREAAAELNHVLPKRVVSVFDFLACGETSVDNSKFAYAGTMESLKCSNPKVQVRIHRILYQHRNVGIGKGIRNLLHEERIRTGSCTQPYKVHTVLYALENVLFTCNLSGNLHPVFLLHSLEPFESRYPDAFKAAGMSPRFPYSRTEHIDTEFFKPCGSLHYLVFALSAARSGDYAGTRREGEHSPFIEGYYVEFLSHRYYYFIILVFSLCGWPEI